MQVGAVRAEGTAGIGDVVFSFGCGVLPGRDEEELVRGRLWLCRLGCGGQGRHTLEQSSRQAPLITAVRLHQY